MFCSQCGHKNDDNMKFCTNCGNPLQAAAPAPQAPVAEPTPAPAYETVPVAEPVAPVVEAAPAYETAPAVEPVAPVVDPEETTLLNEEPIYEPAPQYEAPVAEPAPAPAPAYEPAPQPAYQPAPQYEAPQPTYQQPQYQQPQPTYQQPTYQQPQYQQPQPTYQQPAPQYQYAQPQYVQPEDDSTPGNGMSVASLVLGIIALVFCWVPVFDLFLCIPSLALGIVGKIKSSKANTSNGKAIAGIVLSAIALVVQLAWISLVGGY